MGYRNRRIPPVLRGIGIKLSVDEVYELLTGIRFAGAFETEADARRGWSEYGPTIMRELVTDDPKVTVVGEGFANVLPRGGVPWAAEVFG
jgi:hypothetical protein